MKKLEIFINWLFLVSILILGFIIYLLLTKSTQYIRVQGETQKIDENTYNFICYLPRNIKVEIKDTVVVKYDKNYNYGEIVHIDIEQDRIRCVAKITADKPLDKKIEGIIYTKEKTNLFSKIITIYVKKFQFSNSQIE